MDLFTNGESLIPRRISAIAEKLKQWFGPKPVPLSGAPAVRRQKTYSAQSGYVYQYYYEGRRLFRRGNEAGTEYVFSVSADRRQTTAISVLVGDEIVAQWERERQRELTSTERYAIAKMALFHAFDEGPDPASLGKEVRVAPSELADILTTLDLD